LPIYYYFISPGVFFGLAGMPTTISFGFSSLVTWQQAEAHHQSDAEPTEGRANF
jgi:hypothetical protein